MAQTVEDGQDNHKCDAQNKALRIHDIIEDLKTSYHAIYLEIQRSVRDSPDCREVASPATRVRQATAGEPGRLEAALWAGPAADEAPTSEVLTGYDQEHTLSTYLRILEAEADGADWTEVARAVLRQVERAWRAWESHLARSKWMTERYPHLRRGSADHALARACRHHNIHPASWLRSVTPDRQGGVRGPPRRETTSGTFVCSGPRLHSV
jgi:hypothetical protein